MTTHPSYQTMVLEAVAILNEKKGSFHLTIKKFLLANYTVRKAFVVVVVVSWPFWDHAVSLEMLGVGWDFLEDCVFCSCVHLAIMEGNTRDSNPKAIPHINRALKKDPAPTPTTPTRPSAPSKARFATPVHHRQQRFRRAQSKAFPRRLPSTTASNVSVLPSPRLASQHHCAFPRRLLFTTASTVPIHIPDNGCQTGHTSHSDSGHQEAQRRMRRKLDGGRSDKPTRVPEDSPRSAPKTTKMGRVS
ncbi:hypothetical protein DFS34DRAFT_667495 [Phlyctochytrium arcticum]|nr:hypothetical protein DFS34DRAFT_667495 [Phlyctochytrium arcticum]